MKNAKDDEEWSLQDKRRINQDEEEQQMHGQPYSNDQSLSQKRNMNKKDFKELFRYEENDRDKKALKKDWKKLDKLHKKELEFKHIIGKSI